MPNIKLANEWITFAKKSLETAIVLQREKHYTDVIAINIQQAIEKAFKAIYAYNGDKVPRTHSLEILFSYASKCIHLDEIEIKDILKISDYYQTERYPGPNYFMPDIKEINAYLKLGEYLLNTIHKFVNENV